MARLPRLVVPDQPHHIIQRGHEGQQVFRDAEDHIVFLGRLKEASRLFKVGIHAYILMSDHIHLLASPSDQEGLARMMQWIGRHYVPWFNRKYHRSGTLWQGRYRTTVVDAEHYLMLCSRYIELNPVRSGMVANAADYPWSSYAHHIGLKLDPLITDHPVYWALGNTPFQREATYRNQADQGLTQDQVKTLSDATLKGWALGTEQFQAMLEKQADRRVKPARRGRPAKVVNKE